MAMLALGINVIWLCITPSFNTLQANVSANTAASKIMAKAKQIGEINITLTTRISRIEEALHNFHANLKDSVLNESRVDSAGPQPWVITKDSVTGWTLLNHENTHYNKTELIAPATTKKLSRPRILISNPNPKQYETFTALKAQFNNPDFLRSLNFQQLQSMDEMQSLPQELRLIILGKAIEKYNIGELDASLFDEPPSGTKYITPE